MESGLLLPKARVGGCSVPLAWGLTLNLYQPNFEMLQVYLCNSAFRVCLFLVQYLVTATAAYHLQLRHLRCYNSRRPASKIATRRRSGPPNPSTEQPGMTANHCMEGRIF
jgi:hypothetical protein